MGLKQIIRQQKILESGAVDYELELPGEPMIYSIKYPVGKRTRCLQFFRNMKWASLLKCYYRAYYNTKTPLVLILRLYTTPPEGVKVTAEQIRRETVPATMSYELCDYTLSFLEMLHHVLINSYKQFVKIDVEKWYSARPRTTMKFMKWDHYVALQNKNTLHTEAKKHS